MKSSKVQKQLCFATVILLALPLFFWCSGISVPPKLKGAFSPSNYLSFKWNNWFNGSYQENTTPYINENIGLRNWFIYLGNQYQYTAFDRLSNEKVVQLDNGFLYEQTYIDAITGKNFIGKDSIQELTGKLKFIQDQLAKDSIQFLFVLAPGKAHFFQEHFPETNYPSTFHPDSTNRTQVLHSFKENGINHIDFASWFLEMKATSPFPLYPKTGTHWSYYGSYLAQDSILNYLKNSQPQHFGSYKLDAIDRSFPKKKLVDDDIEKSLNLIQKLDQYEMGYPQLSFVPAQNPTHPCVVISDSYYWQIHKAGFTKKALNGGSFLYYYRELYTPDDHRPVREGVWKKGAEELIKKHKAVIVLSTDANLHRLGFGFIEDYYSILHNEGRAIDEKENAVQKWMRIIQANPEWNEKVKKTAKEKGLNYEDVLKGNAEYMLYLKKKEEKAKAQ